VDTCVLQDVLKIMRIPKAYNKFIDTSNYNQVCISCGLFRSPFGVCGCYNEAFRKCDICGDPITPYNTHKLYKFSKHETFHRHCVGRYRLIRCECGIPISPFGINEHKKCNKKVMSCMWCGERITPYSSGTGREMFCSYECNSEHFNKS